MNIILLDFYRSITIDLSRQKQLYADPKSIQRIEFDGQLKKLEDHGNAKESGNDQSTFVLKILEKIKETRLKFSQGSIKRLKVTRLKFSQGSITRLKVTNTQLNKLKSAVNNKAGTILILNNKNLEHEELPRELLFLTTRQTTKIRNAFSNNKSTDIKHSKAQISKINQSGRSFCCWLSNLGKKALTNVAIPLVRNNLPGIVSNLTSNAISKFESKISEKGAVKAGKGFTLFISNEDMNDSIKIIKSLKYLGVSIDRVTETVKQSEKTRRWISWSFVTIFSLFSIAISNLFSSKKYKWNRS